MQGGHLRIEFHHDSLPSLSPQKKSMRKPEGVPEGK
jgi:hypothetical protein